MKIDSKLKMATNVERIDVATARQKVAAGQPAVIPSPLSSTSPIGRTWRPTGARLRDWLGTPAGQAVIAESGYVPLRP
jgi:hypothetical protein